MARDKRSAKLNRYLLISGFGHGAKYDQKAITLNEGNTAGERVIKTLKRYDNTAKYRDVVEDAEKFAADMGVMLGRKFSVEDWSGLEFGSEAWKQWKQSQK